MSEETTSAALLEQLVYIDNYINGATSTDSSNATPNLDMDGQLSLDLAAFADDSFIFPDEEKKRKANNNEGSSKSNNDNTNSNNNNISNNHDSNWNFHEFSQHQQHQQHQQLQQLQQQQQNQRQPQHISSFNNHNGILDHGILQQDNHHFNNLDPQLSSSSNFLNLTDLPKFPVPPGAKSSLVNAGLSLNQIDLLSALVAQHQASLGNAIPSQTPSITNTTTATPLSVSPSELPIRRNSSFRRLLISSNLSSTTNLLDPIPSSSSTLSPSSGQAAELDKKRRNTAASARFRFKKKLKEKQMETKIQSLEDLIVNLESQLNNLEMENKLLRNLIIEKGSQKSDDEVKLLKEKARME